MEPLTRDVAPVLGRTQYWVSGQLEPARIGGSSGQFLPHASVAASQGEVAKTTGDGPRSFAYSRTPVQDQPARKGQACLGVSTQGA